MNMLNSQEPSGNGQGKSISEKTHRSKPPLLFFTIILLFVGTLIWLDFCIGRKPAVSINFSYLAFALIGVVFHLMTQFRVHRDRGGFDWTDYWFDYSFRAFQACVYVIVIENLVGEKADTLDANMALIALFVGMYIRKVEEAFENMGDRFGDMLKGILGTAGQRLSPDERRRRIEELRSRLLDLKKKFITFRNDLNEDLQSDIDGQFASATEMLDKEKVGPAESAVTHLGFRIEDLLIGMGVNK
ncbi:MAG: hypothetical protein JRJ21_04805 [Deltaproteobacteria bacterium]|nr:hypothetical protein [Deltaproteobacteria bacterium]